MCKPERDTINIAIFADVHGRVLLCFVLCARWQRETGERIDLILHLGLIWLAFAILLPGVFGG